MRVLTPGGVAIIGGKKNAKPRQKNMDEWTHYMYDATGNAVSNDTAIGPPKTVQWVGGPRWGRHHEHMSSINALVSAGGRIFYVMDEGSRASIQLPAKWRLVARDAFNGVILWKRDIPLWYTHIYPLKSGPAFLPRRLVAVEDRVYVTLGLGEPLVCLDAATGKTIKTFKQSKGTEELIVSDGTIFVQVDPRPLEKDTYTWIDPVCWNEKERVADERPWDELSRSIMAIDAETGRTKWSYKSAVVPLSLSADEKHIVFHNGENLVCLNKASGKEKWKSELVNLRLPLPTNFAPTLVVYEDVVLFAGGDRKMSGFSLKNGKKLWTGAHHKAGHNSPEDVLVIDGIAWTGDIAGGRNTGKWTGYDIRTGEVKQEFTPDVDIYWFHHRCHRSKATVDYLLPSRTGIEFVDWRKEHWETNHWVRGACIYGIMPANGLVYAPQHACACYLETKLNGFNALAPASKYELPKLTEKGRLEKGPAYGKIGNRNSKFENKNDWPTYRHDGSRSGFIKTQIPAKIKSTWRTKLGGRLSPITVADGICFVASIDTHTVYALDEVTGKEVWSFTAGGRVDSPPTIFEGFAYFGSADGYVYCVDASNGKLGWRYLAAKADRRILSFEQLESSWPIHGSVLVRGGEVYAVAGRSAFLDGGMRLCRIDAKTGKLIRAELIDENLPETKQNLQTTIERLDMPAGLPDVLSCDGSSIYMRSQRFDLDGKRLDVRTEPDPAQQGGETAHLFCSIGFLDGSWFHRSYWEYGRTITSGCNYWFRAAHYAPSARLMVFDEDNVYGYGRKPEYYVWSPALDYRLFAAAKEIGPQAIARVAEAEKGFDEEDRRWFFNRYVTREASDEELSTSDVKWSNDSPAFITRAMVLAGETLFVAGPPNILDEEAAVAQRYDRSVQKQIDAQQDSIDGKKGAVIKAISAKDGSEKSELKLKSPPVWDGMAAANGKLFMADMDGNVTCFSGK
jgi:outer membrane protein assembly factor BamB